MAKNEQPIFPRAPVLAHATVDTANANLDGTGAVVSLVNGGPEGIEVRQIEVKAEGVTTAGMVRLFLSKDGGTTWELWREISVAAITPSATVQSFYDLLDLTATGEMPLKLADVLDELGAATENAETFNVFARGGSYEA